MDRLSEQMNNMNVNNVRTQIQMKKHHTPYYATRNEVSDVITDYDSFPYTRWWRGVTGLSKPVVIEREAGYRPRHDDCYRVQKPQTQRLDPNHCFEAACSTVYPCYPQYLRKFADRDALNVMLNNACIVGYR